MKKIIIVFCLTFTFSAYSQNKNFNISEIKQFLLENNIKISELFESENELKDGFKWTLNSDKRSTLKMLNTLKEITEFDRVWPQYIKDVRNITTMEEYFYLIEKKYPLVGRKILNGFGGEANYQNNKADLLTNKKEWYIFSFVNEPNRGVSMVHNSNKENIKNFIQDKNLKCLNCVSSSKN